ncbi:hypothetical protein COY87_03585 [Candidatus Roizmanbacteria bacterium CG_4_10_14_0_8_um_filter_33_9]|uniref:DUF2304 domain-containing protein n=1 Tax=Candidatus Roizmanbacteria bacterium CG_4_10_14_0_8_um_filter_33_9 TaxID=1974826 RepID=A0A2M7QI06_9BACT|nr:MAG: hypothetical protein COY87_03585 [Candidatus Roizmanbacteria bacterium CG_4_10_14_0_8_um_filter_33_9]
MIVYIILICISLWFIGSKFAAFIRHEHNQTAYKFATTLFIWGGILFTSLFPGEVRRLSQQMGFGENLNTLIFFGFVIVFILFFRLLRSVENLERNITELVRQNALMDLKTKLSAQSK